MALTLPFQYISAASNASAPPALSTARFPRVRALLEFDNPPPESEAPWHGFCSALGNDSTLKSVVRMLRQRPGEERRVPVAFSPDGLVAPPTDLNPLNVRLISDLGAIRAFVQRGQDGEVVLTGGRRLALNAGTGRHQSNDGTLHIGSRPRTARSTAPVAVEETIYAETLHIDPAHGFPTLMMLHSTSQSLGISMEKREVFMLSHDADVLREQLGVTASARA